MSTKQMIGPFPTKKDFESAVVEYETIRRTGEVNMFALGMFWDRKELSHVMNSYNTGEAQKVTEKKLPKE